MLQDTIHLDLTDLTWDSGLLIMCLRSSHPMRRAITPVNRPQTSSNTSSDTSSHLQYGITDTRPALDQRCSRLVRQLISILLVVDWYIQPVNRPSNHLRVQPVWHLHSGRNREWGAEIKLLYHLGWQPISIMLACVWIGLVVIFSGSNAEYTCQHFHLNLFAYLLKRFFRTTLCDVSLYLVRTVVSKLL